MSSSMMRESEIYYAQLVEAESTRSVMQGIRQVIERHGIFCALYSDRASHFFLTPKAGEAVDRQALTPGRASVKRIGDSIDTRLIHRKHVDAANAHLGLGRADYRRNSESAALMV